jgi:hypothetical protein
VKKDGLEKEADFFKEAYSAYMVCFEYLPEFFLLMNLTAFIG